VPAQLAACRRRRGRRSLRADGGVVRRAARAEAPQPVARAGERSAAPGGRVSVAGDAARMIFPVVRELTAAGAPCRVPVAVTCRVLGFSRQADYSWLADPVSLDPPMGLLGELDRNRGAVLVVWARGICRSARFFHFLSFVAPAGAGWSGRRSRWPAGAGRHRLPGQFPGPVPG
jgi:hypothetical protein